MPPGRPGRGGRKSTHASRPECTSSPHSSRTSRRQACHGVSPSASITPPGIVHPVLYVGLRQEPPGAVEDQRPGRGGYRGQFRAG